MGLGLELGLGCGWGEPRLAAVDGEVPRRTRFVAAAARLHDLAAHAHVMELDEGKAARDLKQGEQAGEQAGESSR